MTITDDEFSTLWQEISEVLVRIAGQISSTRKTAWQGSIVQYLTDPLKTEDERNVQELKAWYKSDTKCKELLEKMIRERINRLELGLKVRKTKPINKKTKAKLVISIVERAF